MFQNIPLNKFDIDGVKSLDTSNMSEFQHRIPYLLEWLEDLNWPVATHVAFLLLQQDPAVLRPYISKVLQGTDPIWKYNCLSQLVFYWPKIQVQPLKPDLMKIAIYPSENEIAEETNLIALKILKNNQLL